MYSPRTQHKWQSCSIDWLFLGGRVFGRVWTCLNKPGKAYSRLALKMQCTPVHVCPNIIICPRRQQGLYNISQGDHCLSIVNVFHSTMCAWYSPQGVYQEILSLGQYFPIHSLPGELGMYWIICRHESYVMCRHGPYVKCCHGISRNTLILQCDEC